MTDEAVARDLVTEAINTIRIAADTIADAAFLIQGIEDVDELRNLLREARDLTERSYALRGTIGVRTLSLMASRSDSASHVVTEALIDMRTSAVAQRGAVEGR